MQSTPAARNRTWLFCATAIALQLSACGRTSPETSQQLAAFGTIITLRYYQTPDADAAQASRELERYFRSVENDWYPWGNGELQRVNAAIAAGETIAVSPPLAELLQRSAELEQRSGGAFNPALGALTELWGFNDLLREDWRPPAAVDIAALLQHELSSRQLHWTGNTLTSDEPRIVLDPGGISKGAILAASAVILRELDIDSAIVDIGGDLLVTGSAGGHAARIGIREPDGGKAVAWLEARPGEAIVTSGNYERFFEYAGTRYTHVLDPRTGYPVVDSASVTVVHHDPVLADAAATALLVAGQRDFDELCAALGIDLALLITVSGDTRLTNGMRHRVHWQTEHDTGQSAGHDVPQ